MNATRNEFYRNYRLARIAINTIATEYREWARGVRRFSPLWTTGVGIPILSAYANVVAARLEKLGVDLYPNPSEPFESNLVVSNALKSALCSPAQARTKITYSHPPC